MAPRTRSAAALHAVPFPPYDRPTARRHDQSHHFDALARPVQSPCESCVAGAPARQWPDARIHFGLARHLSMRCAQRGQKRRLFFGDSVRWTQVSSMSASLGNSMWSAALSTSASTTARAPFGSSARRREMAGNAVSSPICRCRSNAVSTMKESRGLVAEDTNRVAELSKQYQQSTFGGLQVATGL